MNARVEIVILCHIMLSMIFALPCRLSPGRILSSFIAFLLACGALLQLNARDADKACTKSPKSHISEHNNAFLAKSLVLNTALHNVRELLPYLLLP